MWIDEKVIEGKVMKKEQAMKKYDESVARGHTVTLVEEYDEERNMVTLKLGNLLMNQEVRI